MVFSLVKSAWKLLIVVHFFALNFVQFENEVTKLWTIKKNEFTRKGLLFFGVWHTKWVFSGLFRLRNIIFDVFFLYGLYRSDKFAKSMCVCARARVFLSLEIVDKLKCNGEGQTTNQLTSIDWILLVDNWNRLKINRMSIIKIDIARINIHYLTYINTQLTWLPVKNVNGIERKLGTKWSAWAWRRGEHMSCQSNGPGWFIAFRLHGPFNDIYFNKIYIFH